MGDEGERAGEQMRATEDPLGAGCGCQHVEIWRVPEQARLSITPKGWVLTGIPWVTTYTALRPLPSAARLRQTDRGHLLCSDGYSRVGR